MYFCIGKFANFIRSVYLCTLEVMEIAYYKKPL